MANVEPWELQTKIFEKKCNSIASDKKKKCPPGTEKTILDAMKTNRKSAYAKEDTLSETIPEAIKKGITGKKWKDFNPDPAFKKALGEWEDALALQQSLVKDLETYSADAKKLHQDLNRAQGDYEKTIKKSGENPKSNKTIKDVLAKSQTMLTELDDAQDAFGRLSAKEAFFGANLKKSRDVVVSKAIKSSKGEELPDILLEGPKRKQTKTTMKRLVREIESRVSNINTLCAKERFSSIPEDQSAKRELASDVKTANTLLSQASDSLKKLKEFHDQLQKAKAKQKKMIDAHVDKAKMNSLIKDMETSYAQNQTAHQQAEMLIKSANSSL